MTALPLLHCSGTACCPRFYETQIIDYARIYQPEDKAYQIRVR